MRPGKLEHAADLLRLLAHPTRLALLAELARGPKCVSDIQELLAVRQANVSQHLALLRRDRLVDYHEDGKLRCYYLARPGLVAALMAFLGGPHPVVPRAAAWVRQAARRRGTPPGAAAAAAPVSPRAAYWDDVYAQKGDGELSWYQAQAGPSLAIVKHLALAKAATIIDIGGGGPSALAGDLLARGFTDVSVLDVSSAGLQRCRQRLGARAKRVTWLTADVTRFVPPQPYDLWHDRAVFHFLTAARDQRAYVRALRHGVKVGGHAVIAAFAPDGPPACSGLNVARWEPQALVALLRPAFTLTESCREVHRTPWGKPQAFVYYVFRRTGTPVTTEGQQP